MHLAIVTQNVFIGDGQARVNREVVREALAKGHEVTMLADKVEHQLIEEGARWVPVHPVVSKPTLFKVISFARRADRALASLRLRPDVVLANGFVLFRESADVNAVHFVHGTWRRSPLHTAQLQRGPYAWYQEAYTLLNARWEQRAFRQSRVVVAVSELVKGELVSLGMSSKKICVIPNGVDLDEFAPGLVHRSELDLPESVPLALFVGDIKSPRKNLGSVLRALTRVPDVHLAVLGRVEGSPYPALASELKLGRRVHFVGFRSNVVDFMRASDFFVFPSRYEPFSLVLLEAMATGLPVITASTVGAASIVTRENGFVLADPEDEVELARAMSVLSDDTEIRGRMGRAARDAALHKGWSEMAEKYIEVFAKCLQSD